MTTKRSVFLPGVPGDHVLSRLSASPGNEVGSGKLASPESSAALAVNCLGWFVEQPSALPPFPGLEAGFPPVEVDVEFQARFPWSGGHHPWLDGVAITQTHLVGIESKRFEPFRDRKKPFFSDAYNRPVWGDNMRPFTDLRDALGSGDLEYRYLDACQLVKHAFGLVTEARRRQLAPVLLYLYAEPAKLNGRDIDASVFQAHAEEVADFGQRVSGAEVQHASTSYRAWINSWPKSPSGVFEHGQRVLDVFAP